MLYKKNVDLQSKFKFTDKLLAELREIIIIFYKNFYHTKKFRMPTNNKGVKLKNHLFDNKV